MNPIMNITKASIEDVCNHINSIEDAFDKFDKWVRRQKFTYNERIVADNHFNFRFGSGGMSSVRRYRSAAGLIGEARDKEIRELVKKFALRNKLCKNFDDEDEED